jgi:hypothetical protein
MIRDGATHARINVELLDRTLNWITEHPEAHDQGEWLHRFETDNPGPTCGTQGCLAGWTAVLGGYEPYFFQWPSGVDRGYGGTDYVRATPAAQPLVQAVELRPFPREPGVWAVRQVARELLGLSRTETEILFDGGNSRYDLWRLAELFTDGVIVRPDNVHHNYLVDYWSESDYETYGVTWGALPDGTPVDDSANDSTAVAVD